MKKALALSLLLGSIASVTALGVALQDPASKGTRPESRASATSDDGLYATWILIENENEIALSQLALTKASDPAVKQFAQKMIDDHKQFGTKLQPLATAAGYTGRSTTPQQPGDASAKEKPLGEGGRPGATNSDAGRAGGIDHVALLQELGRECYESARKELESKSGSEFDQCYVGMAIGAHMHMNDLMTVFGKRASGDLKNTIGEGQKTVRMHLDHAKELGKKLMDSSKGASGAK